MLLVDDDQADAFERREHRRTRADDDVDVAAANALPLIVPLAVREAAVLDRHALSERVPEYRRDHRRQRDLRHEHQHAPARLANGRRQPQVQLRLPAPCHAVQQGDLKSARLGHGTQASERGGLLGSQASGGIDDGRLHDGGLERIAIQPVLTHAHEPMPHETRDDVGRDASAGELGRGNAVGRRRQHFEGFALFRRQPAGRPFRPAIATLKGSPYTSSPTAVIDATRMVLCASARAPRAFGGSTEVMVSPGPAA